MIYLILLLGLSLRLMNLNQSLWLDEAINVVAAKNYGLKELITQYALGDYHPPLFHPFLWLWIKIFGASEISVRIPSVIFGGLTVLFTYLIAKEITQKGTEELRKSTEPKNMALLATFFMAIAPYNIYFSQEARMYVLEGFLGTTAVYFFIKTLRDDKIRWWLGYTIAITLAIYTDYFGFFIPLIPLVFLLTDKTKSLKLLKKWLISSLISFVFWLPWLPLFLKQFQNAQRTALNIPGWAAVVGSATLKNLALTFVKFSLGRISFSNKSLYFSIALLVLSFFVWLVMRGVRDFREVREKRLLLIWFFAPIIISFLVSLKLPIYQPFRLLYLLPAIYIFLALGVFSFKKKWQMITCKILISLISIGGLSLYYFTPRFQREDWRKAIKVLEEQAKDNDLVVFTADQPMSPWDYYQKKNLKAVGTSELKEIDKAEKIFLFRYLWPVFDPEDSIRQKIETNFNLVLVREFNGVEWWEYKKM